MIKTLIKEYFDWGWCDATYVADNVKTGAITPEDYQEITGKAYVA